MPLNPPSYIGQDVWYSPDVYINQVAAALWQPPQIRGIPESQLAKGLAFSEIEDLQFQSDPTQAANQTQAAVQDMIKRGVITEQDLKNNPIPADSGTGTTWSGNGAGVISNDTNGIENATITGTLPIGTQFKTLSEITERAFVYYPHWIEDGIYKRGQWGLTPGQLVANAKLLVTNVLDPVRAQFPGIRLTSTIRPPQRKSQHEAFQAADIQLLNRGSDWNEHYEIAAWIQNNCPFDQLLLEFQAGGVWVHVSYAVPGRFPAAPKYPLEKNNPAKVGVMDGSTGKFVKMGGLYKK